MKKNIPNSDRVLRSAVRNKSQLKDSNTSDFLSTIPNMLHSPPPPASVADFRASDMNISMRVAPVNPKHQTSSASVADFRTQDPNSTFTRPQELNVHHSVRNSSVSVNSTRVSNCPLHVTDQNDNIPREIYILSQRLNELTTRFDPSSVQRLQDKSSRAPYRENFTSDHEHHDLPNEYPLRAQKNHSRNSNRRDSSNSSYESYRRSSPPKRSTRRRENEKCLIHTWPISFDGSNVKTFLKKLNKLQESYGYDDELVLKFFYLLVKGKADRWYWRYLDEFPHPTLHHLRSEMARTFKTEETELSIISKMYERKQGKDTFEVFYNDILDLNFQMDRPLSDPQIIEILRNNVDDEVLQRIFSFYTQDKIEFYHKANRAYKDVCKLREKRKEFYFRSQKNRNVSELDFDDFSSGEIEEISAQLNNWKNKRSNLKCFNCQSKDHMLNNCPEDITKVFCFKCGKEGFLSPKCPDCKAKHLNANRRVN